MTKARTSGGHHEYCLARRVGLSAAVFAFCAVELALSWKSRRIGYPWPSGTITLVLGHGITIAILVELTLVLKCFRERALLLMGLLRTLIGLLAGLMPGPYEPLMNIIKTGSHVLWTLCAAIAFSLVVSSIQHARRYTMSQT